MERVEDFNLGNELRARTGYMARGTGSDQDRWIFNVADQQGLELGEGHFALAGAGFSGRIYNSKLENGLATGNLNFFWKNYLWTRTRTLVFHVEAAQGHSSTRRTRSISAAATCGLLRGVQERRLHRRALDPWRTSRTAFSSTGSTSTWSASAARSSPSPARSCPREAACRPRVSAATSAPGIRAGSSRSTSGNVARLDLRVRLERRARRRALGDLADQRPGLQLLQQRLAEGQYQPGTGPVRPRMFFARMADV